MIQLLKQALESVNRYFSTLLNFGYRSYDDVYKLILFLFIDEILRGKRFSSFINEEDYKIIIETTYRLHKNSCLIPYPNNVIQTNTPINKSQTMKLRRLQGVKLKITQTNKFRKVQ